MNNYYRIRSGTLPVLGILFAFVLMFAQVAQADTLFSDDFNDNAIDSAKWTTSGFTVTENSGVMNVDTNVTDNGGILNSVWIPINGTEKITITRSTIQHYANDYFIGRIVPEFDVNGDETRDFGFGIGYANDIYTNESTDNCEKHGFIIYTGIEDYGYCWKVHSTPTPAVWDTWFDEEIIYDPATGMVTYSINGVEQSSFNVGVLPAGSGYSMRLRVQAWGWFTGHYDHFDDVVVSQDPEAPQDTTLYATQDTTLRSGNQDRNEGANPLLHLGENRRHLVAFDLTGIDTEAVQSASLVFSIDPTDSPAQWGNDGRSVAVHRVLESWEEGDGKSFGLPNNQSTRGNGAGATWNCAIDTAIENQQDDCDLSWDGGTIAASTTDTVLHTNGMTGNVVFDVTADVQSGGFTWLMKKMQEGQSGNTRYYSKENTVNPNLMPRLILTY